MLKQQTYGVKFVRLFDYKTDFKILSVKQAALCKLQLPNDKVHRE